MISVEQPLIPVTSLWFIIRQVSYLDLFCSTMSQHIFIEYGSTFCLFVLFYNLEQFLNILMWQPSFYLSGLIKFMDELVFEMCLFRSCEDHFSEGVDNVSVNVGIPGRGDSEGHVGGWQHVHMLKVSEESTRRETVGNGWYLSLPVPS